MHRFHQGVMLVCLCGLFICGQAIADETMQSDTTTNPTETTQQQAHQEMRWVTIQNMWQKLVNLF